MSTYTQIIYQIVFSTKHRDNTLIDTQNRKMLYKYIWGILKNKNCTLYRINGVEKHHRIKSFRTEYKELLNEHNIKYQEKYLF